MLPTQIGETLKKNSTKTKQNKTPSRLRDKTGRSAFGAEVSVWSSGVKQ